MPFKHYNASLAEVCHDGASPQRQYETLVLLPGKIVRKNGALAFHSSLVQFFLTVPMGKAVWLAKIRERDEIWAGIRTSYINIEGEPGLDDVSITGVWSDAAQGAPDSFVSVRIGQADVLLELPQSCAPAKDRSVQIYFSRKKVMLFHGPLDEIQIDLPVLPLATR